MAKVTKKMPYGITRKENREKLKLFQPNHIVLRQIFHSLILPEWLSPVSK